jgi:hypothetical protein
MRFFVSYSRRDQARIDPLAKRLNQLGHETWMDDRLSGGQAWWDEILASIRGADALLFAVSETSLESQACSLERGYAKSLGKPLLPVAVEAIQPQLLPPDLAAIHLVDYSTPGEDAAIQLAGALTRLPAAPALPDPLPPPPPIPVSYLSDLSQKVLAESLSLDEQRSLVASLEEGLRRSRAQRDPDDHEAALDLLRKLEHRSDLYAETARRITEVMAATGSAMPSDPSPAPEPSPPPVPSPPAASSGGTGWAAPPPEQARKTPKWIVALAVIGGIFVLLVLAGLFAGSPQQSCFFDDFGNLLCP